VANVIGCVPLAFLGSKSDVAKVVSKMQLIVKIVVRPYIKTIFFVCCGVETSERQTVKKPSAEQQRAKKFQVQKLNEK
jgi:hypothetical protein